MHIRNAVLAVLLTAFLCSPLFLFSMPEGNEIDARVTGGPFPGETSCGNADCHNVTPNIGAGGVAISINGQPASEYAYNPGEMVPVLVTISEPSPAQMRFGFQMTARTPDGCSQAGEFSVGGQDPNIFLLEDADATPPCMPEFIQFPTHSFAKFRESGTEPVTYSVNWTPPPTNIGPIVFAAAGNAANGNDEETGDNIYTTMATVGPAGGGDAITTILSASGALSVAPGYIASGFAPMIASGILAATTQPLPTELLGVSLRVTDSAGTPRLSPLFVVTPIQANYYFDEETALGEAVVEVVEDDQVLASGTVQVNSVAPGIFTANADGMGVPAALLLRFEGVTQTTQELTFNPAAPLGERMPLLLDLGPESELAYVAIFGTGMRGGTTVTATLDGEPVPISAAVRAEGFVGLDQANVGPIPRSFIGRGVVKLVIMVDGQVTNEVELRF